MDSGELPRVRRLHDQLCLRQLGLELVQECFLLLPRTLVGQIEAKIGAAGQAADGAELHRLPLAQEVVDDLGRHVVGDPVRDLDAIQRHTETVAQDLQALTEHDDVDRAVPSVSVTVAAARDMVQEDVEPFVQDVPGPVLQVLRAHPLRAVPDPAAVSA